jgi:hypothetical protein
MGARSELSVLRELDQRVGDGVEVRLLWSERTGSVYVAVEERCSQAGFRFAVDPAHALDAFRHPYAYCGRTRLARPTERGAAAA